MVKRKINDSLYNVHMELTYYRKQLCGKSIYYSLAKDIDNEMFLKYLIMYFDEYGIGKLSVISSVSGKSQPKLMEFDGDFKMDKEIKVSDVINSGEDIYDYEKIHNQFLERSDVITGLISRESDLDTLRYCIDNGKDFIFAIKRYQVLKNYVVRLISDGTIQRGRTFREAFSNSSSRVCYITSFDVGQYYLHTFPSVVATEKDENGIYVLPKKKIIKTGFYRKKKYDGRKKMPTMVPFYFDGKFYLPSYALGWINTTELEIIECVDTYNDKGDVIKNNKRLIVKWRNDVKNKIYEQENFSVDKFNYNGLFNKEKPFGKDNRGQYIRKVRRYWEGGRCHKRYIRTRRKRV